MSNTPAQSVPARLETLIALSRLLDRVESSPRPFGADQYRSLVRQLGQALESDIPAPALQAILGAHPGAAEVYENLHYAASGLSQRPLERSVASEKAATQAIERARGRHLAG